MIIDPNPLLVTIDKNILRVRRVTYRKWIKIKGISRPTSHPYVTGDGFRALANHIHDETGTFNPADVATGDIVFVAQDFVLPYLKTMHPKVQNRYVLICHNGDSPVDQAVVDLIDDKIVRFYAQNVTHDHPKVFPIPLALENRYIHSQGVVSIFNKIRKKIAKKPPAREDRIFFKFSINTNPKERGEALSYFQKHPLADTTTAMLTPRMHVNILTRYKFVASPPGHSIESCRTYEALYVKNIPIVKDFVAMRHFRSLGLPLWIVKDWSELDGLTERDFAKKYEELMRSAKWDAINMSFYDNLILEDQARTRNER